MGKVSLKILVLSVVLILGSASSAAALRLNVNGWDQTMSNSNRSGEERYFWTAVHGWNYVMNNPTIKYRHVNSIMLWDSVRQHAFELGWRWPRDTNPQFFYVTVKNGNVSPSNILQYNVPQGSNHNYSINIESFLLDNPANFMIDGQLKKTILNPWFHEAIVDWNAERQCDGRCETYNDPNSNCGCGCGQTDAACGWETNYGHFWGLRRRQHDYVWKDWSNMQKYSDNDPDYYFYKVSNTDGYSKN